jgi:hypothetical protein
VTENRRPVICTLTAADQRDRGKAWDLLLEGGQVHRERIIGGVRLKPAPGAAARLLELVELERECCAWIDIEIAPDSTVTLTAPGEGQAVLAEMFALRG